MGWEKCWQTRPGFKPGFLESQVRCSTHRAIWRRYWTDQTVTQTILSQNVFAENFILNYMVFIVHIYYNYLRSKNTYLQKWKINFRNQDFSIDRPSLVRLKIVINSIMNEEILDTLSFILYTVDFNRKSLIGIISFLNH